MVPPRAADLRGISGVNGAVFRPAAGLETQAGQQVVDLALV
jgi:hypothetical protein